MRSALAHEQWNRVARTQWKLHRCSVTQYFYGCTHARARTYPPVLRVVFGKTHSHTHIDPDKMIWRHWARSKSVETAFELRSAEGSLPLPSLSSIFFLMFLLLVCLCHCHSLQLLFKSRCNNKFNRKRRHWSQRKAVTRCRCVYMHFVNGAQKGSFIIIAPTMPTTIDDDDAECDTKIARTLTRKKEERKKNSHTKRSSLNNWNSCSPVLWTTCFSSYIHRHVQSFIHVQRAQRAITLHTNCTHIWISTPNSLCLMQAAAASYPPHASLARTSNTLHNWRTRSRCYASHRWKRRGRQRWKNLFYILQTGYECEFHPKKKKIKDKK